LTAAPAPPSESRKSLFRKVERAIQTIEKSVDVASTVTSAAGAVIEIFRDDLGVRGGRLYERRDDFYEITHTFGEVKPVPPGLSVPADYPPIENVIDNGVVVLDLNAPGVDRAFEEKIGADRFAAIAVGDDKFILSFSVDPGANDEDLLVSLGILRHAVDQKIRQERMETLLQEARQIQTSILPKRLPRFGTFDIAGRSDPAEIVGGDFYDIIPVSEQIVGIAIADASGHGLPAALQVRDIYTGLRMGVARDFKIVRTVERLNRIIHESRLTSKFVSLFYGELELSGNFIYVNAGHNPPVLVREREVVLLRQTGMVLGPSRDAAYSRGFVTLEIGDVLVLYTDGIVEATDASDEEFGIDRLKRVIADARGETAETILAAILRQVAKFTRGAVAQDDRTLLVIRRAHAPLPEKRLSAEVAIPV
jgi:sigma-B regulation protein RsbU (phosphoserine phosphatase)